MCKLLTVAEISYHNNEHHYYNKMKAKTRKRETVQTGAMTGKKWRNKETKRRLGAEQQSLLIIFCKWKELTIDPSQVWTLLVNCKIQPKEKTLILHVIVSGNPSNWGQLSLLLPWGRHHKISSRTDGHLAWLPYSYIQFLLNTLSSVTAISCSLTL